MNFRYFQLPITSARLGYEMLSLFEAMSMPDPAAYIRSIERLSFGGTDRIHVLTQSSSRPACIIMNDELLGNLILISGTQGALHVPLLLQGWLNPNGAARGNGANPWAVVCMLDIFSNTPVGLIDGNSPTRIVGYSLGGGVAQVMAEEMTNNLRYKDVECLSFAAPRAGNAEFQRHMARVANTRWFADDDPVRFMPPHVDEVPSVLYYQAVALWEGMDTQVQCPLGRQIEANGNVTITEGNPTRLHAVVPSILAWITDTNGFQSVNHARGTYLQRLAQAAQAEVDAMPVAGPIVPERPMVVNIGNAAYWEGQAEADVLASPQMTLPAGQTVTVTRTSRATPLRYVRRKRGSIWTVQYNGEVVGIGPGKRKAGQLARALNRAALVP